MRKKYKIKQEKIVYFNGQLIERKGIIPLLDAFSSHQLHKIALVITGSGKLTATVKEYSKKFDNIYSFGYQKQYKLPDFYSMSNFFILPSYEETWGLVTVEALAAGLPVIISKFAGSSELISNKNGVLLKKITKEDITNGVLLATRIPKRKYMTVVKNNQKLAIEKLSYEVISSQFIRAFKVVL